MSYYCEKIKKWSRSELMLVHSDLANNNDFDDADRIWSYFIGRLAEHCELRKEAAAFL
jgi:hypothetical protein